mgnify:CR=1 FL=1
MQVSFISSPRPPIRSRYSARSFAGVKTCIRVDSRAGKPAKSGYAPACANEWVRGICEKPRIKCAECPNRRFLPVTDDVIRWHLSGCDDAGQRFVAGVYPMLLDETCFFLAVDFDKSALAGGFNGIHGDLPSDGVSSPRSSGRARAAAVTSGCCSTRPCLRRSRGRSAPTSLTETMERRPDIGFDSYDRFFPNQDTLPHGGFGNLIALPLQKHARGDGNSVFLDDQGSAASRPMGISVQPCSASGARIWKRSRATPIDVDASLACAFRPRRMTNPHHGPRRRRVAGLEPPIVGELPGALELILGNEIYIAKDGLAPGLRNRLLRVAAFQNPEFYKTQAMRLPTYAKPRIIGCAEEHPQHISLPRGCLEDVREVLIDLNIRPVIRDERFGGHPLQATFQGELEQSRSSRPRRC